MIKWIEDKYWAIKTGLRNLKRWLPIIWKDQDWDHCYLLTMMETKFKYMANHHQYHGVLLRRDRTAKQLRICELLCRRLNEENYYDNADKRHPDRGKFWAEQVKSSAEYDNYYLGRMIGKYLREWWD